MCLYFLQPHTVALVHTNNAALPHNYPVLLTNVSLHNSPLHSFYKIWRLFYRVLGFLPYITLEKSNKGRGPSRTNKKATDVRWQIFFNRLTIPLKRRFVSDSSSRCFFRYHSYCSLESIHILFAAVAYFSKRCHKQYVPSLLMGQCVNKVQLSTLLLYFCVHNHSNTTWCFSSILLLSSPFIVFLQVQSFLFQRSPYLVSSFSKSLTKWFPS